MDSYHYSSNDSPNDESMSYNNRDYTNEFTTDQIFESREEMLAWVRSVGLQYGIVVVIKNSENLKGKKMPKCILGCERGGLYKPRGLLNKIFRKDTGTKKCECKFELRGIPMAPDGVRWGVEVSYGVHNHQLAENLEGHEYPSRLKPAERQFVVDMANSTAPRDILSILKKKDPSNTTGIKSVYNVKLANKEAKRSGLNSTQYVLDQLIKKGYFHHFLTDEYTNEITDIVWAHPDSIDLSVNFSSVLVMDATYKTNEYRKPLLEVVGMTSTNLTFSIMFAYLNNEKEDRVTWALDTLKKWMVGKGASLPLVCVTDRDLALMNATQACFPMARHILCIWHINQCVVKKCTAKLGPRFKDFYLSWQALVHSSGPESYQQRWGGMCEEYYEEYPGVIEYLANTWLEPYKERFIFAWTDSYMHLGSNSTQRAESAHSRLKKYLGDSSMSSLQTSFERIDTALQNQFGAIKESFEKSIHIPRHKHRKKSIYGEIRCRVSLYALDLIDRQLEFAADAYSLPLGCCGCSIRTTHGLPCMHDLQYFVLHNQAIPFSMIHPHWTRLSMHTNKNNHAGEQPDEISRLVNILEEMEPDMRSHMVSRFVDMADPSNSSVRGPSYNTEHGRRPMGRVEQSGRRSFSCTKHGSRPTGAEQSGRHSFSVAENETLRRQRRGKGKQTTRERVQNEQDGYIRQLPPPFQQYMSHTTNVGADGHCGFRAIAAHIYGSEEYWHQVRWDLRGEICDYRNLYDEFYPEDNMADLVLQSLDCFQPEVGIEHWMDGVNLGSVIASRYNIVLFTFDANVRICFTHLPLRNPPPNEVEQRQEIAIARVNGNHFVQLFLQPGHPVPPVLYRWHDYSSYQARGWISGYHERLKEWRTIVSQFY